MDLESIIEDFNILKTNLALKVKSVDCFLFGSALRNIKQANDVDILVLYEDSSHVPIIREELRKLEGYYPLHVTYFTFEEEREFDFVKQQGATKIFGV